MEDEYRNPIGHIGELGQTGPTKVEDVHPRCPVSPYGELGDLGEAGPTKTEDGYRGCPIGCIGELGEAGKIKADILINYETASTRLYHKDNNTRRNSFFFLPYQIQQEKIFLLFVQQKKRMRVLFVTSEGMKVTHWFRQILNRLPNVQLVDQLDECDIVCIGDLTTNNHDMNISILSGYLRRYESKPIIVFLHDDPDQDMGFIPTLVKHVHFYRTSLCKSRQHVYESLLPSFQANDHEIEPLQPFVAQGTIKVGFVGASSHPDRRMLCELLQKDKRFVTDFVFQRSFHGHFSPQEQKTNAETFHKNIQNNLFQLCCRGGGNFSHRFYEVLASGRVPVLSDSDLVVFQHIPRDVWINCVVTASNIATVPDAIFAFYMCHDMEQVQRNCVSMYHNYLSYDAFAPIVYDRMQTMCV